MSSRLTRSAATSSPPPTTSSRSSRWWERPSTTINLDAFEPMVIAAKKAGVKRFIYASSSSVYGVSDSPDVTEDHPLVPLTLYNKYKGLCEPVLFKHQSPEFVCVVIRPA